MLIFKVLEIEGIIPFFLDSELFRDLSIIKELGFEEIGPFIIDPISLDSTLPLASKILLVSKGLFILD